MVAGAKPEFPPLLPAGYHVMSLTNLRQLCVQQFTHSITRDKIFYGLQEVILTLDACRLPMDVWVNGSFVTEKLNPKDSDIAIRVMGHQFDTANYNQKSVIHWINTANLLDIYRCDAYVFVEYQSPHPLAQESEWTKAYWLRQFGFSRSDVRKGLAVIQLPL